MPLFRASPKAKPEPMQGNTNPARRWGRRRRRRNQAETDEDGSVLSLTRLCLMSLADNMKDVWAKDYADNYLDKYCFRHIMGPFNVLPGELVEELTCLLCSRKELSRPALHLLLVPQLRSLSLGGLPGLATPATCTLIATRCQALSSLDLSGAQHLPSQVQSDLLSCLPTLRSLSLAGTPCDRRVIMTLAHRCPLLRHLDVSCCHFLSPAALFPLGGGAVVSSSGSPPASSCRRNSASHSSEPSSSFSAPLPPLPLSRLLALDIGFGEEEGEAAAAAAYLLLSLPCLESVAVPGLAQAFSLIHHREFSQTDAFTVREAVPRLEEVWRRRQGMDSGKKEEAGAADEEDEDERISWEKYESGSEDDASREEGPSCLQRQVEEERNGRKGIAEKDGAGRVASSDESLILHLKEVQGLSFASLETVAPFCPDIRSLSLDFDEDEDTGGRSRGSLLATGLQSWSGQLRSISVRYPGPLVDLLPALQGVGSSLLSLTLEGVKTSRHSPLLDVIRACPRLRDLLILAEPPATLPYVEDEGDDEDEGPDGDLPSLPNLCSLTLNFSYDHGQMRPARSWVALKRVLKCLLAGSPLLEKVSLVALPCSLNAVLMDILIRSNQNLSGNLPPLPLGRVQHLVLPRTDVTMITLTCLVEMCKRIKHVDASCCWEINQREYIILQMSSSVTLVWK